MEDTSAIEGTDALGEDSPSGVPELDSEAPGAHDENESLDNEENIKYDIAIIDVDAYIFKAGFGCPEGSPESHALHNMKNIIEKIFDFAQPEAYAIYMGGSKNFRYDIATLRPYKGNRSDRRPEHFQAIRAYLQNNWGAEVVDGIEADDACAILHTEYLEKGLNPVTSSVDKDLDQLWGWHFDVGKDRFRYITEFQAWKNFYLQMLTGDSTDNIPGLEGIGPKKAAPILAKCTDKIGLESCVQQAYKDHFGKDWRKYLIEMGRLLYLQRKPGEMWEPMNL